MEKTYLINELERKDWDGFFALNDCSNQGSVFSTKCWIEAVESVLPKRKSIKIYVLVQDGVNIAGTVCLFNKKINGRISDLPYTPYTGVLIRDDFVEKSLIKNIEKSFMDELINKNWFSLKFSPYYRDIRSYGWSGLTLKPCWDFRFTKDLWVSEADTIKRKKKINEIDESRIEINDDIELLRWFWKKTYNIENESINSFLFEVMKCDFSTFFVIRNEKNKPVAAMLYLTFRDRGYGYGTMHNGKVSIEYDMIRYYVINKGFESGVNVFDWCGANVESRSMYKYDFNPELVSYFQVENRRRFSVVTEKIINKFLTVSQLKEKHD